jgi:hypothetical protein
VPRNQTRLEVPLDLELTFQCQRNQRDEEVIVLRGKESAVEDSKLNAVKKILFLRKFNKISNFYLKNDGIFVGTREDFHIELQSWKFLLHHRV